MRAGLAQSGNGNPYDENRTGNIKDCFDHEISLLQAGKKFLDCTFFPYLDENDIEVICHLGDIVDRRKYINIHTANRMRHDFLEPIRWSNRTLHIIPGNHDCYFKNSNQVNILREVVDGMEGVKIYMRPTEVMLGKTNVLFVPWMCEENEEECLNAISATKAQVLFGHLELQGFEMRRGSFCDHGHHVDLLSRFDLVCSGHFHHKSTYRNINYLGNPFEMTWSDYDDPKGFHVFDTDTRALEFVSNPDKLFRKIHYDDAGKKPSEVMDVNFSDYKDSYVKVIVHAKTNPYLYDSFVQKLENAGPIDVKSVEDHLNLDLEADSDIIDQSKSTVDVLTETVRQAGISEEYQKPLENLLRELYNEASILNA